MPSISKIRFTHVLYEGGNKRYNDEVFLFDGFNGAIILENGGGKTVFIQTALQVMLPHADLARRRLKDTLLLENGPAHVAIEWILNDKPRRRYAVTCVSLYLTSSGIDSYRYAYEYGEHDAHGLENIPFARSYMGNSRPADRGEIQEYYASMTQRFPLTAHTFGTIKEYKAHLEEHYQIIASEWEAVAKINSTEGGIEHFFDECKTTSQLFDRLLIPTIEETMEGFETDSFVELFHSHREGFKRYKELKEQITENKLILQELGHYMRIHEGLHKVEEAYNGSRAKAKALHRLSLLQHEEQKAERQGLESRLQLWMKQNEALEVKLKSIELAEADEEKAGLLHRLSQLQNELDGLQQRLSGAERVFYSLKYSEHRADREAAEARLRQLSEQLARLEKSQDERQLQEQWEQRCGELRTVFARDEEQMEKALREHEAELDTLKREQDGTLKEIERLRTDIWSWELKLQEKQTQLQGKKEQQGKIAHAILANPTLEKVEEQLPLWSQRQQMLEEKRIDYLRQLKGMNEEQGAIRDRQRAVQEVFRQTEREQARLERQQEQFHEEQEALIRELSSLRPNWERLHSVFEKEASIGEQLQEGIHKRQEQKAASLQKERLAYRYVDDYYEQDVFFADSVIERLVQTWGRQFHLLQIGTEYARTFQSDGKTPEVVEDPLWSVTLITTDGEKKLLLQKLAASEFAYPIRVLGTVEAAAVLQGNNVRRFGEQWAVPAFWKGNEEENVFLKWKTGLLERAQEIKQLREDKEEELARWQKVHYQFSQFLQKYSLSHYQALEQQLHSSREALISYAQEVQQHDRRSRQLEEQMDKYRAELTEMQDMIHQLNDWLKDGLRYTALGMERGQLEKELVPIREQIGGLQRQVRMKQISLKSVEGEQATAQQSIYNAKTGLHLLRNEGFYRKVQDFAYVETSRSLIELKQACQALEREREGLMKEQSQLEMEQSYERDKAQAAEKGMNELLREHPDLNREMAVPIELEAEKQAAWVKVEYNRSEWIQLMEQLQGLNAKLQNHEGRIETLLKQFHELFESQQPMKFDGDLGGIRLQSHQESEQLKREKREWQQRNDAVKRQLQELERVMQLWDKHTLIHRLNDPGLLPATIQERLLLDFTYARMDSSERAIAELHAHLQKMEKEQLLVRKGKDSFKHYCNTRVRDVKLRQMAIQGIELKENYEEVVEFKQTMETRIQKALHIMEETIQSHDRDLQEFIGRIHTHLKHIVQELRELPKKTRIKAGDGWREIYSFSIPEWEEQEGKDRVRGHIEWILSQLEREQFVDEQGKLQQAEMRKRLEKWLDSRQLLQVVLKNEAMKVTCRKVTNDHQVTKAAFSWEQSNRWSGGEKWSKNMTLFLGLLNYVAERRQYIIANRKLHRAVILDNPFGKASSEHVLSPVFFIAEQLGFQIIALTAHAEGKFLQDYFPIVYSCRLRITSDASKKIIEPSKRVQHAYFRDHSPETLERFDARVDQMELF